MNYLLNIPQFSNCKITLIRSNVIKSCIYMISWFFNSNWLNIFFYSMVMYHSWAISNIYNRFWLIYNQKFKQKKKVTSWHLMLKSGKHRSIYCTDFLVEIILGKMLSVWNYPLLVLVNISHFKWINFDIQQKFIQYIRPQKHWNENFCTKHF